MVCMQLVEDICRRTSYICRPTKHTLLGPHAQWEMDASGKLVMVVDMPGCIVSLTARCGGATSASIKIAALHQTIRMAHSQAAGAGSTIQGKFLQVLAPQSVKCQALPKHLIKDII